MKEGSCKNSNKIFPRKSSELLFGTRKESSTARCPCVYSASCSPVRRFTLLTWHLMSAISCARDKAHTQNKSASLSLLLPQRRYERKSSNETERDDGWYVAALCDVPYEIAVRMAGALPRCLKFTFARALLSVRNLSSNVIRSAIGEIWIRRPSHRHRLCNLGDVTYGTRVNNQYLSSSCDNHEAEERNVSHEYLVFTNESPCSRR